MLVQDQKGFIKLRWLLLLGLLAGGVIVYAKENPSSFLVKPPYSLDPQEIMDAGSESGFRKSLGKTAQRIDGQADGEAQGLADPQSLTRKQEANFYEATVSKISEGTGEVKDRASAVASCIEEAASGGE